MTSKCVLPVDRIRRPSGSQLPAHKSRRRWVRGSTAAYKWTLRWRRTGSVLAMAAGRRLLWRNAAADNGTSRWPCRRRVPGVDPCTTEDLPCRRTSSHRRWSERLLNHDNDVRPSVTFPAVERHCTLTGTKLHCLLTGAQAYKQLVQSRSRPNQQSCPRSLGRKSDAQTPVPLCYPQQEWQWLNYLKPAAAECPLPSPLSSCGKASHLKTQYFCEFQP